MPADLDDKTLIYSHHLYEIHTLPQPPLVSAVMSGEDVGEVARLRDLSLIGREAQSATLAGKWTREEDEPLKPS